MVGFAWNNKSIFKKKWYCVHSLFVSLNKHGKQCLNPLQWRSVKLFGFLWIIFERQGSENSTFLFLLSLYRYVYVYMYAYVYVCVCMWIYIYLPKKDMGDWKWCRQLHWWNNLSAILSWSTAKRYLKNKLKHYTCQRLKWLQHLITKSCI